MQTKRNAITLIELLVVLAILAILAVILIPPIQKEIKASNARYVFNSISEIGLKEAQKIYSRDYIKYGLERKPPIFTKEQIESEQKKYEEKRITEAETIIEAIGTKIITEALDPNQ